MYKTLSLSTTSEGDQEAQKGNYNENKSLCTKLSLSTRVQKKNYNQNKSIHYIQTLSLSTSEGDQEAQKKNRNKLERKRNLAIHVHTTQNTVKRPKILNSFLSNPKTVKIDHFFLFFYSTSISNYVESYTSFERVGNNLSKKIFFPKETHNILINVHKLA